MSCVYDESLRNTVHRFDFGERTCKCGHEVVPEPEMRSGFTAARRRKRRSNAETGYMDQEDGDDPREHD